MSDKDNLVIPTESTLRLIKSTELFPENLVQHTTYNNKEDGYYDVIEHVFRSIALIKDNKIIEYKCYEKDSCNPFIIWSFEYDDDMSIYREFPIKKTPRHLFCNKFGRTDEIKASDKIFSEHYNIFLKHVLNETMQLNGKIESVQFDETNKKFIANTKDGDIVQFN